jgi:DNA-binding transcriptional ArsR family regulator
LAGKTAKSVRNGLHILTKPKHRSATIVPTGRASALSAPAVEVSQHLAALRASGAVSCRRSRQLVYYSISDPVFLSVPDLVLDQVVTHQS